jgi:hypothetical protein
MAYKIRLTLDVEALDAVYTFGCADKALSRVIELSAKYQGDENFNDTDMPADFCVALCELFIEGCIGWKNVMIDEETELEYSEDNKKNFPTDAKIAVAMAYFAKKLEVEEKKE